MRNRVYLAGPINGCTDEECKDWRAYAKEHIKAETYDPMVRDYRDREHEPGIAAEIVEADKADIEQSDVLLVNYVKPSVGTSMEILYAWLTSKPVIVVCSPEDRGKLSPWLLYHASYIVTSMREACVLADSL